MSNRVSSFIPISNILLISSTCYVYLQFILCYLFFGLQCGKKSFIDFLRPTLHDWIFVLNHHMSTALMVYAASNILAFVANTFLIIQLSENYKNLDNHYLFYYTIDEICIASMNEENNTIQFFQSLLMKHYLFL